MPDFPDTRATLLRRIADAQDAQAWDEFARIYEPFVYRLARRQGLQHADAEELVQETMLAVARAVDRWEPDPQRGRFRDWLYRISRNLTINLLTRRKYQAWGTGDSDMRRRLEAECHAEGTVSDTFDLEYRRAAFRWAAERVQAAVKERTWQAFWLSSIDDRPIREVAERLGMSASSVYIARSRVMARLREEVRQFPETTEVDKD